MVESDAGPAIRASSFRWWQLTFGVICMALIANLQYSWTLFVPPMIAKHGWTAAGVQGAFSVFIFLETWFTPINGWIADKLGEQRGPRIVVATGGVLVGVGWVINSFADSLTMLYVGAVIGGLGGGGVYAVCVGNATKWFADRRGFAVGMTAAGYGAGTALSVIPIQAVIKSAGYEAAFFWFGVGQGAAVFLIAWLLRGPREGEAKVAVSSRRVTQTRAHYSPWAMISTPTFWLLYLMFVVVAGSGLMATAQIALIAKDYGVGSRILVFGATTISVTLIFDSIMNGAARPFFGWVSDRIGRESTMAIAFSFGGVSYWLLGAYGSNPWLFVLFAGTIFFTWGEIFSLFPSTCTDTYGSKFATVNAAVLYTAKGTSAVFVSLANVAVGSSGDWHAVFVFTAIANFAVVALALFVLRPLRARQQAKSQQHFELENAPAS